MAQFDEHPPGMPCWVDLMSTDVGAAKQFYGEIFGWSFDDVEDNGQVVYALASLKGRHAAGLMQQNEEQRAQGMPPMWNTHIAVTDTDATVAKAGELGGTTIMPPMDVMDAGRMAVLTDPTGAAFCVWQPREHKGAQIANEPGTWGWSELDTRDTDAAAAFYEKLFGWKPTVNTAEMGGMSYTEFKLNDTTTAGMMNMPPMVPAEVPPYWLNYFVVDDADGTIGAVTSRGGSVLAPAMDLPIGRIAVLTDPQGAAFAIIQLGASAG